MAAVAAARYRDGQVEGSDCRENDRTPNYLPNSYSVAVALDTEPDQGK